ncbi:MAG: hypothetical protein AAB830_03265 [Patescibacteria group bacterium]
MAHIKLREKARALRQGGESVGKIATTLHASKSTVSYWCRDISLSDKQIQNLVRRQNEGGSVGRLRAAERKRSIRIEAVQTESRHGAQAVGIMSQRDLFILGIALYWGEGYKSGNEECGLTNSNPNIIRAFILWLKRAYSIPASDLILRVSINNLHHHRIDVVEKYWSKVTGIPHSQFTKTSLIRTSPRKIYSDPEQHYGTLRVKVRRATALRRRILGSIDAIAKQIK